MTIKCEICEEEISKYKCPKCRVRYCSVKCYKKHTEVPCKTTDLVNTTNEIRTTDSEKEKKLQGHRNEESEDRVSQERLEELGNSQELRDMLDNPHLRQMMVDLTKSQWPAQDMETAMHEPIFVEFADECLKIMEARNSAKSPEG